MKTVVIVEDHPVPREQLCAMIKSMPHLHLALETKAEQVALAYIQNNCPDLLLVDMALPGGGNGLKIVRHARNKWADACTIVVLSSSRNEDIAFQAIQAGARNCLNKDDPPNTWPLVIEDSLNHKSNMTPRIAQVFLKELKKLKHADELSRMSSHKKIVSYLEYIAACNPVENLMTIGIEPQSCGFFARSAYKLFDDKDEDIPDRQLAVLYLLNAGNTAKEIARALDISENTVRTHIKRIYEKFEVNNVTSALARAREKGYIS